MRKLLKLIGLSLLGIIAIAAITLLVLVNFSKPRTQLDFDDPWHTQRSQVIAEEYAVVSGTPWATEVAVEVLENGGNAVDAAVAAVLMLNITFGEAASFPGVAPVMYYDADDQTVRSYVGAGVAPAKATIEEFWARGHRKVPNLDILAQLVPASPDVLIRLLQQEGTMSFSELVQPAIDRAREGFPVHHTMSKNMNLSLIERLGYRFMLPTSSQVYFGKKWWLPLSQKDEFKRPLLANTLEALAQAEKDALASGESRENALEAVRDYFYKGPIAEQISAYHEKEDGLIQYDDLANYTSDWETPIQGQFGEYTIYTNGTWTQGIVLPWVLQMLEGLDLKAMGHNSPDYVHTLTQAIDLAMADRDLYVADPTFEDVPLNKLLSKEFAQLRRSSMRDKAFQAAPRSLDVAIVPDGAESDTSGTSSDNLLQVGDDTSQVVVMDSAGNAIAITPSDFPMSPMIPGTGLTLGIRMTQFRLEPSHVNRLEPGKRPRITPHAAMIFKNGEFYMALNTPGGDMQAQALVQVFLNHVVFGMNIQEAINAPRLRSENFPGSFDPDEYGKGILTLEQGLYNEVAFKLIVNRNYNIKAYPNWDNKFSAVGAIIRDGGRLYAGSDPRESATAAGK
ncbi:MAG: gamma-glutamyltransferase [Bacteroidota bacterium]